MTVWDAFVPLSRDTIIETSRQQPCIGSDPYGCTVGQRCRAECALSDRRLNRFSSKIRHHAGCSWYSDAGNTDSMTTSRTRIVQINKRGHGTSLTIHTSYHPSSGGNNNDHLKYAVLQWDEM